MDVKLSIEIAQANFDKFNSNFPRSLEKREEKLFIRLSKAKISNKKKLLRLYSFMNTLYEDVHKYTPCKKGCSNCCYYTVTVTEIEIQHIEETYNIRRNNNLKAGTSGHGRPCCFLKNNGCSIYEARPYVCRRHITFSPNNEWCSHSKSLEHEFPLLSFTEVDKSYDLIRRDSKSLQLFDIRNVFGVVL